MKLVWLRIPKVFRNIYFATFLVFALWLCFFDQNDVFSQLRLRKELKNLQKDSDYYRSEINRTREELDELLTNNAKLEKFARERYLMKKENEEIFVIVKE